MPPVEVLVWVPDTPFPLQLPVGAPGKTMDGVPGSQLWPGPDLHVAAIGDINYQMEGLYVFSSK